MRIGSLFSGAAGLDRAVDEVFGGRTVWHCETDPAACKVLAHRFPGVPNLGDITRIDWATVEPVDVLCGGFPCQDVSSAGRRAGLGDGTRTGLWARMADAIAALRPAYVVAENVRGLLSATAHRPVEPQTNGVGDGDTQPVLRAIGAVLGDLADIGYDAQWCTVSAADVGAPHRRERVFIIATPTVTDDGTGYRQRSCPEPGQGDPAPADARIAGFERRPEPAGFVRGSDAPVSGDGPVTLLPTPAACNPNDGETPNLLPTPTSRDHKGPNQRQDDTCLHVALCSTPQARDYKGVPGDGFNTACLARDVVSTQWGKYAPAIARWETLTRPAPPPTEPNRNGNPRLNPAFSEWLMGWPDGWVTQVPGISRNDQLKIIGNGVVPLQAVAALRHLLAVAVTP